MYFDKQSPISASENVASTLRTWLYYLFFFSVVIVTETIFESADETLKTRTHNQNSSAPQRSPELYVTRLSL